MDAVELNLVVIRVRDIGVAGKFYTALGLTFAEHSHGTGPQHLSTTGGPVVVEIYPATSEVDETRNIRIGFVIEDIERAVEAAIDAGGQLLAKPKASEWGLRAILMDPFGNKVELIERNDP